MRHWWPVSLDSGSHKEPYLNWYDHASFKRIFYLRQPNRLQLRLRDRQQPPLRRSRLLNPQIFSGVSFPGRVVAREISSPRTPGPSRDSADRTRSRRRISRSRCRPHSTPQFWARYSPTPALVGHGENPREQARRGSHGNGSGGSGNVCLGPLARFGGGARARCRCLSAFGGPWSMFIGVAGRARRLVGGRGVGFGLGLGGGG